MNKTDSGTAIHSTHQLPANKIFPIALADIILKQHADCLPDLSHVHIFIPNALAVQQLRYALSQQSNTSILGLVIDSLPQWLKKNISLPESSLQNLPAPGRQLLLLDALKQYPTLFKAENIWQVCDSLLTLFDELNQHAPALIDFNQQQWQDHLQQAYGSHDELHHLSQEAQLVHSLWQAWHTQMQAMNLIDDSQSSQIRLMQHLPADINSHSYFYIIDDGQFSQAEIQWIETLSTQANVIFIQQIPHEVTPSLNSYDYFLHQAYDHNKHFKSRCQEFKHSGDIQNISKRLFLFDACSHEQEAQAICLQTRLHLLNKKQTIAIITEDRKLARRVRAILERDNINVRDTAGWLLPTTSAATIIERWLECIEEDFSHQPMLDLLKSPFFCTAEIKDTHLNHVYRLEQDIIRHENIPQNIQRYQRALGYRQSRLKNWNEQQFTEINNLLQKLHNNAQSLTELFQSNTTYAANLFLTTLINSLKELGIWQQLEDDQAGQCILQNFEQMVHAAQLTPTQMHWKDFRIWFASTLDTQSFTPFNQHSPVQLMNMQQAQYCYFDAIIIASANKQNLPGNASNNSFFNQTVRSALSLPHWQKQKQQTFLLFKCLLQSSTEILLTYTSENNGETIAASAWFSSLDDFSKQALNINLQQTQLTELLNQFNEKTLADTKLPQQSKQASPIPDINLLPKKYSASRYQRLINCPYLFFAADVLALRASDEIKDTLQKSEYGEKVHLILHLFHQQIPFIKTTERKQAKALLIKISTKEFSKDLEDNIHNQAWLTRWTDIIDNYLDWQIEQQKEWHIAQLEKTIEHKIDTQHILYGRLDRIDKQSDGFAIIDYKTGRIPTQADSNSGEDIQLASYAALMDDVKKVTYLKLDKEVKTSTLLQADELENLKNLNSQRLLTLISALEKGTALTAWGDKKACEYCDMSGLCRKQNWQ